MQRTKEELWARFQQYYLDFPQLGLALDISRMNFDDGFFQSIEPKMQKAFAFMKELEAGAIANPDEKRMVGHYWLRNPALAPTQEIRTAIETTVRDVKQFAAEVHAAGRFKSLLLIGIGGSALGPQFVAHALGAPTRDPLSLHVFDNTDPDGMDRVLARLGEDLNRTLCIVISKSGGTKETRNGMLEAEAAYKAQDLNFGQHAVAITETGSQLDLYAEKHQWLRRFPMWNWVGGRTSETSAVGLLPAALQGFDIEALIAGAKACDEVTRQPDLRKNPAAILAAMLFYIGKGRGEKNMVVLPYKDRLELFSKYLQQLVMESLGKEKDLDGNVVNQGLTVYGNKGSTDQHAYIQQLRDGRNDFFVTFIEVLSDCSKPQSVVNVEDDVTSGDFLTGFLLGTRQALYEKERESVTITLKEVSGFSVGVLIALFERAVGLYAQLINVNAYHQPGVEAGKKAAGAVIDLQRRIISYLNEKHGHALTSPQIASGIGAHGDFETVFKLCNHLAANGRLQKTEAANPFAATFQIP